LFSAINKHFEENKEKYFANLENEEGGLKLLNPLSIGMWGQMKVDLLETNFSLLPSTGSIDAIYKSSEGNKYSYAITKL